MAELATIARPYAEALFKAAKSDLNGTAQWLDALAAVAGNAQLLQFADNPKVTAPAGVRRGGRRCQGAAAAPPRTNFLRTVIENGRLAALPEIAHAVPRAQERAERLVRRGGVQRFPDRGRRAGRCGAASLEKRFGRKLNVTVQEDPSLIGGIRVVVGDEVLDTSVKARLEQMKVALTA